jgi:CubicO group peptidase (beta-lactamase class C family)
MKRYFGLLAGAILALNSSASSWALEVGETDRLKTLAGSVDRLHALLVLHDGEPVLEHVQAGPGLDRPANLKSLSKTVLSLVAGIAIDRGVIENLDQPILDVLDGRAPANPTEGAERITLEHALSLQTGLASTSGRNYGRWVQSDNWVAHVLTRPMVAEPGMRMIYSTGSSHLTAAALAAASDRSVRDLAREWIGQPLNIRVPDWMTDPQGIHFGGNEMQLSPRALGRIGELYRLGGQLDGERVVSAEWVRESWTARGRSPWSGDEYGLGWFITRLAGERAYYGRGYGGQMLYVIPGLALTVVITSDPTPPSSGGRVLQQRNRLVGEIIRAVRGTAIVGLAGSSRDFRHRKHRKNRAKSAP